MQQNHILTLHRVCRVEHAKEALALCAMRFNTAQEADEVEAALRQLDEAQAVFKDFSFANIIQAQVDTYCSVLETLIDSTAQLSFAYLTLDKVPKTGSCVALYQLYRTVTLPWRSVGATNTLLVEEGFNDAPCLGDGCKYAYVGGSDCESKLGVPVEDAQAHLRIDDLKISLERTISPLSTLSVQQTQPESYSYLYQVLELCLCAFAYNCSDERGSIAKSQVSESLYNMGRDRITCKDGSDTKKQLMSRIRRSK